MDKEKFLKELKYQLRFLSKAALEEELKNYDNAESYTLKAEDIANSVYQKRGLNIKVKKKNSFFDSVAVIIEAFKDKQNLKGLIFFFLYTFLLIILIKVPYIYIRDVISSIVSALATNETLFTIWDLTIEIIYALTAILIFIKFIKIKALEFETE